MQKVIQPGGRLAGRIALPGDKSISHRYAIVASLADGRSVLHNYATGADCHSTLGALRALGVSIHEENGTIRIDGGGLDGWRAPIADLDAGNSGSAMRMLAGPLAAQPFRSRIVGDESLSRRPMGRIIKPLADMGAEIEARDEQYPPLTIHGRALRPIDHTLAVASAQVKTCILLAGLFCDGETIVREPVRTRDHTEIALREFGGDVFVAKRVIRVQGRPQLKGSDLEIPGDLSSAAFFLVAASVLPGSDLTLPKVGLNPTRSMLLDFLLGIGAHVRILEMREGGGEMAGDLKVTHAPLRGGLIEGAMTAALIDEIPVLGVLGALSENGLEVRDAAELRVKETDRIAAIAENFQLMGVETETRPDGIRVPGKQKFRGAVVDSRGDHRIAMALAVAALTADRETTIENAEAASVSFPEFYELLETALA